MGYHYPVVIYIRSNDKVRIVRIHTEDSMPVKIGKPNSKASIPVTYVYQIPFIVVLYLSPENTSVSLMRPTLSLPSGLVFISFKWNINNGTGRDLESLGSSHQEGYFDIANIHQKIQALHRLFFAIFRHYPLKRKSHE